MQKKRQLSYASPFSRGYWQQAVAEAKNVQTLALAAIFVALRMVLSNFYIPLGDNLNVFFSFLVSSLGGAIYGPVVGLLTGFCADILGYFLHPVGGFFPGYTLNTMLGAALYAVFLYRRPISFFRLLGCKLTVNLGVNVLLGSVWSAVLYSKGYYYYLLRGLAKNLLLWPVETVLLFLFLRAILPQTHRLGLTVQKTVTFLPAGFGFRAGQQQ